MNKALWCGNREAGLLQAKDTSCLNRTSQDWDYMVISLLVLDDHQGPDGAG